ncbi:regulatory protein RecX [Kineosporia babensis]|uniref:Regulatory protein RecX n=1 Tax=Kineosporia babensis TaxID=499548 RepID=A0A9X1NI02_9ACTN|nr:RecX family transcriptional regulator [Kineosporia babensis]
MVSLDGSKLNPHDLRDMIAQKEADWRAADPGDASDRPAGQGARSRPGFRQNEPAPEPGAELAQPAWTLPGWGEDTERPTKKSQRSGVGDSRRSNGLGRRGRGGYGNPSASPETGAPEFGTPEFGASDFDETEQPARRERGTKQRKGLSRGGFAARGRGLGGGGGRRGSANPRNDGDGHESVGHEEADHDGLGTDRSAVSRGSLSRRPPVNPEEEAREILLKQLSAGPRTRSQLAKALDQREIPDEVARTVLDRFEEVDLVDDAAFSRQYVENRHSGRGLAKRALAYELRQKGVADETAREAVDSLSSDDELATARQLVRKKAGSMTKDDPERRMRRLAGMLARKGYSSGIAYQAIREELADLDAEGMFGHPDFD